MIVVAVITSRGARRVTISAVSSSLTSSIVSAGVAAFLVHCRIQLAAVTACIIFASRTFIWSDNFTNLHGMVGRCTGCYILERRGAAIALPATKKYSFQRSVFLIWECPDERVSLASGNYDIAERSELLTRAAQFLDYSSRIVFISHGNLQTGNRIVQPLHARFTITLVVCF